MTEYVKLDARREKEAEKIHGGTVIIDGLLYGPAADSDDYFKEVKDAGVTATNVTVPAVTDSLDQAEEKIRCWKERIERNGDFMTLALSAADIERAKRENKTAVIMGTQDAVHLDGEIENADGLKEAGIRIIQLTYQRVNAFGNGCGIENDEGLTAAGKELVKRLNDLGVLIDLSHCGYRTTLDAIEISSKPCAFTHANVKALCDHPRNKTDEQIKALAEKGGVMGIVSYSAFSDIKNNHAPTLVEFLDIIEYVINLAGIDHVGIGLDFTPVWTEEEYDTAAKTYPEIYRDFRYGEVAVKGIGKISQFIDVTHGLLSRGYGEEEVKKILGGNFLRLFREVWGE